MTTGSITADAEIVRKITYRDMPTATRAELMGALEPTATLMQTDVLTQLERLDGREREERVVDLTNQIRWLTVVAVVAAFAALLVALVK